ncbi:MAG: hypothetical protein E4H01_10280, partial [Lysobacterales bacterium]
MPIFEITSPEGKKYRVTAPEGATREDALQHVQSTISKESSVKPSPANPAAGIVRDVLSNVPGGQFAPDLFMGLRSIPDAGAQLLTRGMEAAAPAGSNLEKWAQRQRQSVEATNQEAQAAYQQYDPESRSGSSVARALGASIIPGIAVSRLAPAATLAGKALQGGTVGGAQGALTPVEPGSDFWDEKAMQTGTGLAVGGAAAPIAGRILSPKTSPEVKQLLDAGVTPPPGQVLGGAFKSIEEATTSIPLYGEAVKAGQSRAIHEFNRALYMKTLAPLGSNAVEIAKKGPIENEGIKVVGDTLSNAYEQVLQLVRPSPLDANFMSAIGNLHSMTPTALRDDFANAIRRSVLDKMTPAGTITASVFKYAESELGRLARSYKPKGGAESELGRAFDQAKLELRTMVARTNPTTAPHIQAINNGWTTLVQVERAGAMIGAKDGVISPAQFLNAVQKSAKDTVRGRGFARGTVLNQDFAQAADKVLSRRIPDSGTPFRGMVGAGAAGLGGFVNPLIPAAAGTAALSYTPFVQRMLAGALTKRPDAVRRLGDLAPYLAAPATSGLLG